MIKFGINEEQRKDDLIRMIERSVEQLNISQLEALYYDMFTKGYIESED